MKLLKISEKVLTTFTEAQVLHVISHDLNNRQWALEAAKRHNCAVFKASPSWLYRSKKAHKIVSRKVTKFVSTTDLRVMNYQRILIL